MKLVLQVYFEFANVNLPSQFDASSAKSVYTNILRCLNLISSSIVYASWNGSSSPHLDFLGYNSAHPFTLALFGMPMPTAAVEPASTGNIAPVIHLA